MAIAMGMVMGMAMSVAFAAAVAVPKGNGGGNDNNELMHIRGQAKQSVLGSRMHAYIVMQWLLGETIVLASVYAIGGLAKGLHEQRADLHCPPQVPVGPG